MIKTIQRQVVESTCCAVCSACGADGPQAVDVHDADVMAQEEGWTYVDIYPEGEHFRSYTCPECNGQCAVEE